MKKKIVSLLVALCLLATLLPAPALALRGSPAAEEFAGSGTEADPYCIESLSDLELLRDKTNAGEVGAGEWFRLYADVNMSLRYGPGRGEGGADRSWTPIGEEQPFAGIFDGGGHTITGLYINVNDETRESLYHRALFGKVGETGAVKNISVEGFVSAPSDKYLTNYVAGVAGFNEGILENCHSGVDVVGKNDVGGVAGYNGGMVKNCSNRGRITADGGINTGGVVGLNANDGIVENCYNTGAVSGGGYVGGVVGKNAYHSQKMANCYNTGSVTGTKYVGGIAGLNEKSTWGVTVMENCFNTGTVTGGSYVGGAIGYGDGTVTNCYYLDTCGAGGARGESKTAEEFKTLAALLGAPFEDSEFLGRPVLQVNFQGFLISSLADLERFRDFVNAGNFAEGETVFLTADIDFSSKYGAGKDSWTPIGTDDHPFVGTFDGGGRQITGFYLYDDVNSGVSQGLFGTVGTESTESIVQNLGVSGSVTATASSEVGGIVGRLNKGTVSFCHYAGSVTGNHGNTGGVVGYLGNGSATCCSNTGSVTAESGDIGGIAGFIDSGAAVSCYNTGTVTATGASDVRCGPVVGSASYGIQAMDCYYLDTCGATGAGESKTAAEFASGEVAHLLQSDWGDSLVWGQTLTGDGKEVCPVLTDDFSKAVCLVTFQNGDETVSEGYVNFGKTTSLPETDPASADYAFAGWYTQAGTGGEQFTAASAVQGDTTLYAQWRHKAPAAPAIDYEKETLATTAAMEYSTDGTNWRACTADMPTSGLDWSGLEKTVRFRTAATAGYHASDPVDLTIPARPAAPHVSAVNETAAGKSDGQLTGVSAAMEYKLSTASSWTACDGPEITGLAPGSYQIRTMAVASAGSEAFASVAAAVTIEKGTPSVPPSPPVAAEPQPCPQDETCPISVFTDSDPAAWYHDGVHYCLENGLMSGFGNRKFGPNDTLTRAQLTQILYHKEGLPSVSSDSGFVDVTKDRWYAKAVSWAAQNGIAAGYGGGRFGPNDSITREQLAVILWRYAQKTGSGSIQNGTEILRFPDTGDVADWAKEAMTWAVDREIIRGKSGVLDPKGSATRAEAAAMLRRYCERAE